MGEIKEANIAAKGTSFDLAMALWNMWFEKRTGHDWKDFIKKRTKIEMSMMQVAKAS